MPANLQLVDGSNMLEEARRLFGDERADYKTALQKNYHDGPPPDWQERFISTYASCHPSEDFAECWAHFFHVVDTLETAHAFGLSIGPSRHHDLDAEVGFDPYRASSAQQLVDAWVPISLALNTISARWDSATSIPSSCRRRLSKSSISSTGSSPPPGRAHSRKNL